MFQKTGTENQTFVCPFPPLPHCLFSSHVFLLQSVLWKTVPGNFKGQGIRWRADSVVHWWWWWWFMANLFYYQRPAHSDTDIVTRWIFWGTYSKQLTTLWLSPSAVVLAFSADVSLLQVEVFEDFLTSSCWAAMCCVEESLLDVSSLKEKKRAVQYFILFFLHWSKNI